MNRKQIRFESLSPKLKKLYKEKYALYMTPGQFMSLKDIKTLDRR